MKPDADEIIEFINNLAKENWLGFIRSRWIEFAFHYTDIRNAVEILKSEKLLCRTELEERGIMPVDNASQVVISNTERPVKDFIRLYFRPKTPTQYRNEGVRPIGKRWEESHCPVPVFFLFDLKTILIKNDSQFSQGNLAKFGIQGLCSTASELKTFEFKKIFHTGSFNQSERDDIISHRNAEIVIPKELDLSELKFVVCRSPAEKETLLNLLSGKAFTKWSPKIFVDTKANLFERKWAYIQSVYLTSKSATIDFSPDAIFPSPFNLTVRLKGDREEVTKIENFSANETIVFKFIEDMPVYEIEVKLDNNLVYLGKFDNLDEIPF
jgi:hypothetical protein